MAETEEPSIDEVTRLIAELHSAGYSNDKIGYLLPHYGGKRRDEATVRRWAIRKAEPKASDFIALQKFKAEVFHVEHSAETPSEVVAVETVM